MVNGKKVVVVMPAYNASKTLQQTYDEIPFDIVDDVILVDDLVDTAGTLCKAAEVLIQNGANRVKAICTHPILSGKAYENIENSKLEELLVCDTIPLKRNSPKIKVFSTAKLFAKAIMHTHDNLSISQLFVSE